MTRPVAALLSLVALGACRGEQAAPPSPAAPSLLTPGASAKPTTEPATATRVKDGRRTQIASWSGAVTGNWHELRVDAREDRIQVQWDGTQVIDATDRTFTAPGKVGVWTKADSVTYFDDLTIMPL